MVDGNNLMFALSAVGLAVGRAGLCRLLGGFAAGPDGSFAPPARAVHVVLDGFAAHDPLQPELDERVRVTFSMARTADEVIAELVAADTAPRRLTVVSTDRQVRAAARRRRCPVVSSQDFARRLVQPARSGPDEPDEPAEKAQGLTADQTRRWLHDLHLDDDSLEGENDE